MFLYSLWALVKEINIVSIIQKETHSKVVGVKITTSGKASPKLVGELKHNHILQSMFYEAPDHQSQSHFHSQLYQNYQLVQVCLLALTKPKIENCQANNRQHLAQWIFASLWTTYTKSKEKSDKFVVISLIEFLSAVVIALPIWSVKFSIKNTDYLQKFTKRT